MTGRIIRTGTNTTPSPGSNIESQRNLPSHLDDASAEFSSLVNQERKSDERQKSPDQANESSEKQQQSEGDADSKESQNSKDGQSSKDESGKHQQESEFALPSPEIILGNLTSSLKPEASADVASAELSKAPVEVNAIINQVAEQLTVSELSSGREVSIKLKESILPGTEVRLVQQDGRMQVRFVTASPDVLDRLTHLQTNLQTALQQKLPGVDFAVSVEGDSSLFQENRDGQSQGRQDPSSPDDQDNESNN